MLTRDAILAAQDLKSAEIDVPEWGGTVRVRMMTGAERDAFEREQYELHKIGQIGDNMRARLIARCVVDENNKPLFTLDDVNAIGAKSSAALERIARVAGNLNKLESVEEEAKN